jgi:predicted metal-dependent phosphoesterase TrpH
MTQLTDYHIHSYFSDGDLSPEELVDRYAAAGYREISITDHNEIEGSRAAFLYAAGQGISVVPGIEISTRDEHENVIHMLGYFFDYDSPDLKKAVRKMKRWRAERNDRLFSALLEEGYDITLDDLMSINEGRYIGKPTFAAAMMKKGYIGSVDEAFATVFSSEKIARIRMKVYSPAEALEIIHRAGGLAVFAHPMELRRNGEGDGFGRRLAGVIDELVDAGIDGIECFHPSADAAESAALKNMAVERGLIVTGGSDFHSDSSRRFYEG